MHTIGDHASAHNRNHLATEIPLALGALEVEHRGRP
jgi:hypothetical protein